jgi:hypothetical protein
MDVLRKGGVMFFHHLLSALATLSISLGNVLGLCTLPTPEQVNSYEYARYVETPKRDSSCDFSGKDSQAAKRLGMNERQYAIEGMEWPLRLRLYNLIRYFDQRGVVVGITTGYRDDYRQAIACGRNKNKPGNSFHGGSLVGGWGKGQAVDLVAIAPTREEQLRKSVELWAAIDKVGKSFGLGRPFGSHDAPHVAPLESREFAVASARLKARWQRHLAKLRKAKAKRLVHHHIKKLHVASS